MRKSFKQIITGLIFCFQTCAQAQPIDKIIIFGDSMSDNGNIYALTTKAHKIIPSIPVIPKSPPYYEGRFSNGPVWVDDLAMSMNVPLKNYAYGGSWAEPLHDSRLGAPFSLGMQVDYYLVSNALDLHKGKHLYFIWTGGNDYLKDREDPEYATTNTVESIEKNIKLLLVAGVKNLVVFNLPDISLAPGIVAQGPTKMQAVKTLVTLHNEKLQRMMLKMKADHPQVKIIYGDVAPNFDDLMAHPEKYNLKNATTGCFDGGYSARSLIDNRDISAAKENGFDILGVPSFSTAYMTAKLAEAGIEACANPDEYMFWDQIHPTRVVHNLFALDAALLLANNDIQGLAPNRK